jgi:hypothetical protein
LVSSNTLIVLVGFLVGFTHLESIFYLVSRNLYLIYLESTKRTLLTIASTALNMSLDSTILAVIYGVIIFFFKEQSSWCSSEFTYIFRFGVIIFIFFYLLMRFFFFAYKFSPATNPFIVFSCFSLFFFLILLTIVRSFMVLFFFLEVVSVYYYFFFLCIDVRQHQLSFIKYKNFIVYYLWNSFLTSICAGISLGICIYCFGSSNFLFLNTFTGIELCYCIFFFFFCIFLKVRNRRLSFLKIRIVPIFRCGFNSLF